jgi:hypothetical protein
MEISVSGGGRQLFPSHTLPFSVHGKYLNNVPSILM